MRIPMRKITLCTLALLWSVQYLAGKCLVFEGNINHWQVSKNLDKQLESANSLRDCLNLSGEKGINQILTLTYSDIRDNSLITFFIMDGIVIGTTEIPIN